MPASVVLLAALIGLLIVKIVDTRLQDISINMPTVNLPSINIDMGTGVPQVTVASLGSAAAPPAQKGGAGETVTGNDETINLEQKLDPTTKLTNVQSLPQECKDRTRFIASRYASDNIPLKNTGITPEPSYIPHSESPAPYPGHSPVSALETEPDPRGDHMSQYYLDPKVMTDKQLDKFMYKASFDKMTVVDYTNWLLLFQNEQEKLSGFHRANLRILLRGGKLRYEDLPRVTPLPPKADHEYMSMINAGTLENTPQPDTLGYLPFNYDLNIGAKPNRSMRHLDFINPDEPLKTWVLTREGKPLKSAKALNADTSAPS
jgi:hypothetical protein